MNIFMDSKLGDDERRALLYQGAIFFHSPCEHGLKLCQLARERVEQVYTWDHLGDRLKGIYNEVVAVDPGSDVANAAETSRDGLRADA